jgi:hypothetical protein
MAKEKVNLALSHKSNFVIIEGGCGGINQICGRNNHLEIGGTLDWKKYSPYPAPAAKCQQLNIY